MLNARLASSTGFTINPLSTELSHQCQGVSIGRILSAKNAPKNEHQAPANLPCFYKILS